MERRKARVRAKVEHVFFYLKRMFSYRQVRYRGLANNRRRLALLVGLTHLVRANAALA